MGAFARWRALSRDERWLTTQSCLAVGSAVALIRAFGVERSLRLASRPVRGPSKTVIADCAAAVERAGRYVPGGSCLPKSLALAWMLRRSGVVATVRIGVKTAGQNMRRGRFEAHAWVECNGVAVQHVPPDYAPILTR